MTTITSSAPAEFSRIDTPALREPSSFRVNLLRGAYALIVIGQGLRLAPQLFDPSYSWELQRSVVVSMLTAMVLMSLLGLRYPLKMLPVLLFEITWKAVWLLRVALPAAMAGTMSEQMFELVQMCLVVGLVIAAVPWDYVVGQFVRAPGDEWWRAGRGRTKSPDVGEAG